jgi:hypothetical protein
VALEEADPAAAALGETAMEAANPVAAALARADPLAVAPVEVGPKEEDADDWMEDGTARGRRRL